MFQTSTFKFYCLTFMCWNLMFVIQGLVQTHDLSSWNPLFYSVKWKRMVQTRDLPGSNTWSTWFKHMIYLPLPFCRKKRFSKKWGRSCVWTILGPKARKSSKKRLAQDGSNTWSTYPSHSAERSVFGPKKGSLWSTFFGRKKTKVDHKIGPLDGSNTWST